ncbi:hypothetical protein OROHE_010035 [Orobanche hederae]
MREKTGGRDLVRPEATRFATAFLTLQCLYKYKEALRMLFVSEDWSRSKLAYIEAGKRVCDTVLSSRFWTAVENYIRASQPLLIVMGSGGSGGDSLSASRIASAGLLMSSRTYLTSVLNMSTVLFKLFRSVAKFISAEEKTGVTFDDFAGQEYIKRELQEIVKILNNEEYQKKVSIAQKAFSFMALLGLVKHFSPKLSLVRQVFHFLQLMVQILLRI